MIRDVGVAYHCGQIKHHHAVRLLKQARDPNIQAAKLYYKRKIYIEANNNLFSLCTPLREAFPGCVVIGMIRDVRTWIVSMSNRGYSEGVPWFKYKNPPAEVSGPIQLAHYYTEKITAYENLVDYMIRYEDLVSENGYQVINQIGSLIGLRKISRSEFSRVRATRLNYAKRGKLRSILDLPLQTQADIIAITDPLMNKYYGGQV
jgi:hypothetical protein